MKYALYSARFFKYLLWVLFSFILFLFLKGYINYNGSFTSYLEDLNQKDWKQGYFGFFRPKTWSSVFEMNIQSGDLLGVYSGDESNFWETGSVLSGETWEVDSVEDDFDSFFEDVIVDEKVENFDESESFGFVSGTLESGNLKESESFEEIFGSSTGVKSDLSKKTLIEMLDSNK